MILRRTFRRMKSFYNTNLADGEFAKHKGAYALAAVLGYTLLHASCGCPPLQGPDAASDVPTVTSALPSVLEESTTQYDAKITSIDSKL